MTDDDFPIRLSVEAPSSNFQIEKYIKIPCISWRVMRQAVLGGMHDGCWLLRTQHGVQKQKCIQDNQHRWRHASRNTKATANTLSFSRRVGVSWPTKVLLSRFVMCSACWSQFTMLTCIHHDSLRYD